MKFKNILSSVMLMFVFTGCATVPSTGPGVEPEITPKVEEIPDEPIDVIFAGFAFLGDCRENEKLYPFISRLAERATCPDTSYQELNKELFKAAERINNPNFIPRFKRFGEYFLGPWVKCDFSFYLHNSRNI